MCEMGDPESREKKKTGVDELGKEPRIVKSKMY